MRNGALKKTQNYRIWKTENLKRNWEANRRQNQRLRRAFKMKMRGGVNVRRLEEKNQRYDWEIEEDDEGENGNYRRWW